ncbi:syntaxin-binding protein 5-like isoform X3 [Pomacea canaliculata]|uniref:syntaxin-binding protein 5-like isoform X3 n=1 Tax=Pomacea canaliculata TaxID=400727 RepID=UPI000D731092|nr:syntaxin-binding protein 5-like isoform X3 [Pomacea canaliculata]
MSSSPANAKMKRFTLRGVLDGLRSSVSAPTKSDTEIEETLRSEHFHICKTVRHGFPYQPTSVAFDPVQHILAIGNKTGSLRIIGRPGVDIHCTHDGEVAIFQVLFLINEGALVTVCSDDTLHLWNYRQKKPEIVHSLKFQRERITYCHLPFQSKWLYIGTERGNVHIVNIESFVLSGYVINWNKAIELSRKTHPGPVVHLSDNPVDSNKLLIGFESGAIVMWDLRSKSADCRFSSPEALRSIAWHHEGKQFICSHSDGSLSTWNVKAPHKAASILMPHAKIGADGKPDPCKPIAKVAWKSVRNGEDMIIFSGGMSYDRSGRTPSITVMTGKSTTVLEMEHSVVDFVTLCETPWCSDFQDPYAIVVLLQNDLVVVDLTTPGYPCFENPYPMDLHESPVTACQYYANCPTDLIPAFYSVGSRQKKTGFSEKTWPINGGQWGTSTVSYPEIMITGHADGSLKFWDASSVSLQILYKLKTAKIFEKPKRAADMPDDDPFAIQIIYLCPESRILCVAGTTHIMLFRFSRQELTLEVTSLEFSIVYEIFDELDSPEFEYPCLPNPSLGVTAQHSSSMGSYSSNTSDSAKVEQHTLVKVRPGSRKWTAGYQADLVCILCFIEGEPPGSITVMSLNSSYGLMAFGNESGLAIVDFVQKTCLLNLGTPDLYGSMDPYQRAPRSPRTKKPSGEGVSQGSEEGKSPTTDQINGLCLSPTSLKQKKQHAPELKWTKSQGTTRKIRKVQSLASVDEWNGGDRNDGSSFSRSRSSSINSLDNVTREAIQCLVFADSYTRKTDNLTCPCLWVGTSLGSVIVINLNLPGLNGDQRLQQPVIVSPSGTIFRLKGSIVGMSFLDCNGILIPTMFDYWKEGGTGGGGTVSGIAVYGRDVRDLRDDKSLKTPRQLSVSTKPKISPTSSTEVADRQFVIICSEKQARVMSLPSQTCAYKVKITETSFVVRAEIVALKDSVCLMCYVANGHIMAFSLPSLKPLYDEDFLPLTDYRVARTFCFSNNGHALYLCSPTEVQKITYSAEIAENLSEMLGDLFLPCDTPEAPKQGFFKNLFGGGPSGLDREELFGEASGKASKGLAKIIPGAGGMQQLHQQAGAVGGDFARTRMLVTERGEKLGDLDDRSAQMMNQAENFAQVAHQIMLRYKDKKWYQF